MLSYRVWLLLERKIIVLRQFRSATKQYLLTVAETCQVTADGNGNLFPFTNPEAHRPVQMLGRMGKAKQHGGRAEGRERLIPVHTCTYTHIVEIAVIHTHTQRPLGHIQSYNFALQEFRYNYVLTVLYQQTDKRLWDESILGVVYLFPTARPE